MAHSTPDIPYNDLPKLPPKRELIESSKVLKKAIQANKSLAELKGFCQTLPNPALLLNTVIIQESKDSSAIENIVTTQDDLYKAVLAPNEGMPSEVKEVLRYREAIDLGRNEMSKLGVITGNLAIKIMQRLKHTSAGFRTNPGTKIANPKTRNVIYTPPDPLFIPKKMSEWEKFINDESDIDPLIRMSLMHYQFEAIHPFGDGNGRTGRILNVLYLVQQNLLTLPVLYHSAYIIQHKNDYYRCLREVTEDDKWEQWVMFMLDAVDETSKNTLKLISEILKLKEEILKEIQGISQKLPAYELNELLFSFPYIKIKTIVERGIGSRQTISKYLNDLAKKGVLHTLKMGRDIYFVNHRLMDILVTFK